MHYVHLPILALNDKRVVVLDVSYDVSLALDSLNSALHLPAGNHFDLWH